MHITKTEQRAMHSSLGHARPHRDNTFTRQHAIICYVNKHTHARTRTIGLHHAPRLRLREAGALRVLLQNKLDVGPEAVALELRKIGRNGIGALPKVVSNVVVVVVQQILALLLRPQAPRGAFDFGPGFSVGVQVVNVVDSQGRLGLSLCRWWWSRLLIGGGGEFRGGGIG